MASKGGPQQFAYEQVTPVELNQLVKTLLMCSKNSSPYFPPLFAKKICENQGLECNQNVFFNLMSNIVDYKLDQCMTTIKENSTTGSTKKQIKDLMLKTVDVEKMFMEKEAKLARPRVYPQLDIDEGKEEGIIPQNDNLQM